MNIDLSKREIEVFRRFGARINGKIGGTVKSSKRAAASRRNAKLAVRARKIQLAAA
jgi:hypothetical protein